MGLKEVISELNRVRGEGLIADYAIGGAVAADVFLEPSSTLDVDVFVVLSEPEASAFDPFRTIWPNLIEHGAKQLHGPYLEIGGWPVQLLQFSSPLYDQAVATAKMRRLAGDVEAKVMEPPYLAAIALAAGRSKDYGRVEQFLKLGILDRARLEEFVERFGLTERWNTFRSRYLGEK